MFSWIVVKTFPYKVFVKTIQNTYTRNMYTEEDKR